MVGAQSSPKAAAAAFSVPRTISSIAISVGGLALFLILGSWFLVSSPIASTVQLYFLGTTTAPPRTAFDNFIAPQLPNTSDSDSAGPVSSNTISESQETPQSNSQVPSDNVTSTETKAEYNIVSANSDTSIPSSQRHGSSTELDSEANEMSQSNFQAVQDNVTSTESSAEENVVSANSETSSQLHGSSTKVDSEANEMSQSNFQVVQDNVTSTESSAEENVVSANSETSSQLHGSSTKVDSGSCDLYHGKWFYDSSGPLYTNNTCPVLTQMQNCQGNGRRDKDYENWRWKPSECDLPRFDPKKFLELMRGKTLAFIGDSVARNQMESMLCILWQVEVPKNHGNKRMQRWFFRSTSVNVVRVWSSWLVHQTSDPLDFAPAGVVKLHLDIPDDSFMDLLPSFDVVVLSSGHWFAKQSVYILKNKIVGGQLWWPDNRRPKKIDNVEAFGISVETIVSAMGTHPNYTGLTIVRSYSPDHYEGGAWNTGGSCTGKSRPALEGELVENGFTNIMHEKQVMGFKKAMKRTLNQSKLRLMDITEAFSYRHDGHPGPYRNPDPNKITTRGPHGEPPPQDCLHWCMPGPVDTWNEIVLEIIRTEFEGKA